MKSEWGPLFAGLEVEEEIRPMRVVEDLEYQRGVLCCWRFVERCPEGLILRDGVDYWTTETLWVPGSTPGRTYALRIEEIEYEYAKVLRRRNPFSRGVRPARKRTQEAA